MARLANPTSYWNPFVSHPIASAVPRAKIVWMIDPPAMFQPMPRNSIQRRACSSDRVAASVPGAPRPASASTQARTNSSGGA